MMLFFQSSDGIFAISYRGGSDIEMNPNTHHVHPDIIRRLKRAEDHLRAGS